MTFIKIAEEQLLHDLEHNCIETFMQNEYKKPITGIFFPKDWTDGQIYKRVFSDMKVKYSEKEFICFIMEVETRGQIEKKQLLTPLILNGNAHKIQSINIYSLSYDFINNRIQSATWLYEIGTSPLKKPNRSSLKQHLKLCGGTTSSEIKNIDLKNGTDSSDSDSDSDLDLHLQNKPSTNFIVIFSNRVANYGDIKLESSEGSSSGLRRKLNS